MQIRQNSPDLSDRTTAEPLSSLSLGSDPRVWRRIILMIVCFVMFAKSIVASENHSDSWGAPKVLLNQEKGYREANRTGDQMSVESDFTHKTSETTRNKTKQRFYWCQRFTAIVKLSSGNKNHAIVGYSGQKILIIVVIKFIRFRTDIASTLSRRWLWSGISNHSQGVKF